MTLHLGYIYTLRDRGRVRITGTRGGWVDVVYPANVKGRIPRKEFLGAINWDFPPEPPYQIVALKGKKLS